MIVVLADDLAGAAEMGGMAWRHGLSAEVQLEFDAGARVDVVVVNTDTRSCTAQGAARRVAAVAGQFRVHGVERVFKKVDSVLRGQVAAELVALIEARGNRRCLLVPANPGLGRVISRGQYYVHGVPLHETDFAKDPEYPATTSGVSSLLSPVESWPVRVLRQGEGIPARGMFVGEATSKDDLTAWASALQEDILPAGASEFFAAYLCVQGYSSLDRPPLELERGEHGSDLFVCGSTSASSHTFCERCEANGIPVLRIPLDLLQAGSPSSQLVRQWAGAAVSALQSHPQVVLAIDRPLCEGPAMPQILSSHLSAAVEQVLLCCVVDRLFVEGGATAAALVHRMGWDRFRVRREWATGVVSMCAEGLASPLLTMKPGSYAWPDQVLA